MVPTINVDEVTTTEVRLKLPPLVPIVGFVAEFAIVTEFAPEPESVRALAVALSVMPRELNAAPDTVKPNAAVTRPEKLAIAAVIVPVIVGLDIVGVVSVGDAVSAFVAIDAAMALYSASISEPLTYLAGSFKDSESLERKFVILL